MKPLNYMFAGKLRLFRFRVRGHGIAAQSAGPRPLAIPAGSSLYGNPVLRRSKDWQGHVLTLEIDKLPGKKFPLYMIPEGYKRIEDENGYSVIVKKETGSGAVAPEKDPDFDPPANGRLLLKTPTPKGCLGNKKRGEYKGVYYDHTLMTSLPAMKASSA